MADSGIESDIDQDVDEIEEDIDRDAGYDHDAASEIQTSIAKLENSSVEIAERADYIKDLTSEQYSGMDKVASEVSNLSAAIEILESLGGAVQEINAGIQEVASATDQQAASAEEVASMVDQSTTNAQQIAGEVEEIVEEIDDQTGQIVDVNQAVDDLVEDLQRNAAVADD